MTPTHETIRTNGINLHVVKAGPEDGPLVVLLHGFPEFWRGFEKQMEALAAAGFHVWVPDQRGYNLSDKPETISAYSLDELARDVLGLFERSGREKVFLAGHDWGAAAAWWTAIKYPQYVEKLAILNVPHPAILRSYMRRNLSQLRRSWYMFFFQIPGLPEWILSRNDFEGPVQLMQRSARPGTFSDSDLERYREAWRQPGAMGSMINWYRALFRHPPDRVDSIRVQIPVRIIWGKQDSALEWPMAEESLEYCDDGELFFLDQATHWVQHDEPERVNELLLSFFQPTA